MGSITFTLVGDASIGTKTKAYAISDADLNRWMAVLKVKANPVINGTATVAQACVVWADSIVAQAKADTVAAELAVAQAAVVTPSAIVAT